MSNFLCPFPWVGTCVTTSGAFRVCPVSQSAPSRGVVRNLDAEVVHLQPGLSALALLNQESMKDLRRRMMEGRDLSDTCKRCLLEEDAKVVSRRQLELARAPYINEEFVKQWTEADGTLKKAAPISQLIVRLGNKCNLACRMCGPSSSTAWYQEWHQTRHRGFKEDDQRIALFKNSNDVVKAHPNVYQWTDEENIRSYIASYGKNLTNLHFSGGEPLLSKVHGDILEDIVAQGFAANVSLEYNSNLTVLPNRILELWSQFKDVEIGISVDGAPLVNEYIRYPIKSKVLENNIHKLDQSAVRGRFWIATTVQIYNVLYLEELRTWLKAQNFKRIANEISWHVLQGPEELSIFALPTSAKNEVVRHLQNSSHFNGIAEIIFAQDKSAHFKEFFKNTDAMDSYRRQTIKDFPELWRLLSAHSPAS